MSTSTSVGGPFDVHPPGAVGPTGPTWQTTGNVYGAQFTGAATYTINSSSHTTVSTYDPNSLSKDVVLHREGKPPLPLGKTLDAIIERLCIIEPAFEMMEKYPALKEAYENYKMIEALIKNDPGYNK